MSGKTSGTTYQAGRRRLSLPHTALQSGESSHAIDLSLFSSTVIGRKLDRLCLDCVRDGNPLTSLKPLKTCDSPYEDVCERQNSAYSAELQEWILLAPR